MELKNQFVIYIAFAVFVVGIVLSFLIKGKKEKYKGGKKVANTLYMKDDPYFKKKMERYKAFTVLLMACSIIAVLVSFFMLARPYKIEITNKERYSRDIILCIDVSSSVDALNDKLVDELKDTVKNLKGERFGIVIFNSSPVLLSPLTDDYEFVLEQLDMIKQSLDMRISYDESGSLPDNWYYLSEYISGGTLVGAEERGSSLIGDGLAASVYDFSELEKDRTRVIIFSTDNDIQGTPIVTLSEAADICVENNVTVYGIGTKEMTQGNIEAMKNAVLKTGGEFYLEETADTFDNIVSEIEKKSKNLVKSGTEIREIEIVGIPFVVLLSVLFFMMVLIKVTKR